MREIHYHIQISIKGITPLLFLILASFNLLSAQEVMVSTLFEDINASGGLTKDAVGNFYVSDFGSGQSVDSNTIVYKINKDDLSISVFCDGFIGASGACFDSQGNFYQANNNGNRISKIHPDGIKEYEWVSDGLAQPIGVIADSQDNIFVCNCSGNYISKITPDGSISTFAEDPMFNCPNGLTIDSNENLYVCNFSDGKILKITPDATVSLFAEMQALTGGPSIVGNGHITYHDGYLYVNLIGLGQIQRICLEDGVIENVAGLAGGFSNSDGPGSEATFSKPNGIVFSVTGDTILINTSVPTWLNNPGALHPGMIRMITGVNSLDNICGDTTVGNPLFSQITEGAIVEDLTVSTGSSWADYDNDGDMDVFVCTIVGNNRLYRNNGDLTFTVVEDNVSLDESSSGSAVWGDYDNDGYIDLYVSNNSTPPALPEANFLYRNAGPPDFNFIREDDLPPAMITNYTWSSSWVDFDNDGDLDLHVPENRHLEVDYFFQNNYPATGGAQYFTEYPANFNTDTIESTGVVSWMDYDNDCDQDLFMIKSGRSHPDGFENNRFFHNALQENGTLDFIRVTSADMVNHLDKDFQASWGDYDNDGDMDVYLGNFDSNNYLYRNEGDSLFTAITTGPPVEVNSATLGSTWGDFDNDGDLDLFVSNTLGQNSAYYENDGAGNFTAPNSTIVGPPVINIATTQSCSNADINNDGYLDLFVANAANAAFQIDPDFLYLNNGGDKGYLLLTLKGTNSNAAGIGAKVRIKTMIDGVPTWQMRVISGGPTGDRAQNSLRVHFGLGDAEIIDSMIVEWTNCQKDIYTNVFPDQICEITEGGLTTCQLEPSNSNKNLLPSVSYFEVIPNPITNKTINIQYELKQIDTLQIQLYDLKGQLLQQHTIPNTSQFQMSVPELSAGIYIVKLQIKEGSFYKKVTIP